MRPDIYYLTYSTDVLIVLGILYFIASSTLPKNKAQNSIVESDMQRTTT